MIPLLFLDVQWMKKNPLPTILIGVIFLGLGIALMNLWKAPKNPNAGAGN